jgi:uncharacterized membrane protein YuzA (DUF378 family)
MATTHTTLHTSDERAHVLHTIDYISMVLMIIGGINWGLVGLADFDLVAALFGEMSGLSRVIYVLVGLASLYGIYMVMRWSAHQARNSA